MASDLLSGACATGAVPNIPRSLSQGRCTGPRVGACCGFACALAARRVEDVVCDLGLWMRWWPGVLRVRALPGGCQRVGDQVLLEGAGKTTVLRVLNHRPGQSLCCALESTGHRAGRPRAQHADPLHLDIQWQPLAQGCALRLGLSRSAGAPGAAGFWAGFGLRIQTLLRARALQQLLSQHARTG